ncbi:MAG: hypothetical protein D3904_14370 [Candidatus Electrothrix sp. EH2]|nr:hypothetical protein [Candidatus Electrothrix sp. EH2]
MTRKQPNRPCLLSFPLPSDCLPGLVLTVALSIVLFFISRYSYLLFHSLVELFSVIVAVMMFVVAWHTYNFSRNNFLMYLGCGYFWIALLDLLHTLMYKGMTVFPTITGANPATQFWIAGRSFEALLLLTAPFFLTRPLHRQYALCVFACIAFLLISGIFSGIFPDTYQDGIGLTSFKIYSEYSIVTILILSALFLRTRCSLLPPRIYRIMLIGITLTVAAGKVD